MSFPQLTQLMAAWFNQDVDLSGDTDAQVLERFAQDSGPVTIAATMAELDRMLALPVAGLRATFEAETGPHDLLIGETDADVRAWLMAARDTLARL